MMKITLSAVVLVLLSACAPQAQVASSGPFDFERDLKTFYRAQLEHAYLLPHELDTPSEIQEKEAKMREFYQHWGIKDAQEWKQIETAAFHFHNSERAKQVYGGQDGMEQLRRAVSREFGRERDSQEWQVRKQTAEQEFNPALLAPIGGLTLEQYAKINNAVDFQGAKEAFSSLGVSEPAYRKAQEGWAVRFSKDRSGVLNNKYQAAYFAQSRGRFAASGREAGEAFKDSRKKLTIPPVSEQRLKEIQSKLSPLTGTQNPQTLAAQVAKTLSSLGYNEYEWRIIANWWALKQQRDYFLQ